MTIGSLRGVCRAIGLAEFGEAISTLEIIEEIVRLSVSPTMDSESECSSTRLLLSSLLIKLYYLTRRTSRHLRIHGTLILSLNDTLFEILKDQSQMVKTKAEW